jgi:BirA family transcriptional regulator, biotin operon repressor / biotin---[acetyl-CoA-carboxylase] ligase
MTESAETDRRPLSEAALSGHVVRPGGLWQEVSVAELTRSTNADLVERARTGAPEGAVLVAEEQSAGRGRMGRAWLSPPRAALTFSVLLRPGAVPPARRAWLPLLAGVATATALRPVTGLAAELKWPNDLLIGHRKLAGILAEQSGDAVVVGIGLNVSTGRAELPAPAASSLMPTSLLLEGSASLDRELLLRRILDEVARWYADWCAAAGDPEASGLRPAYLRLCSTIGREVRVELPAGQVTFGRAADVDADGRLIVTGPAGAMSVGAGDVLHVR